MLDATPLTLTPEEYRAILLGRVERTLAENGVTLTQELRKAVLASPLPPDGIVRVSVDGDGRRHRLARLPIASDGDGNGLKAPEPSSRSKEYTPTTKAKPIEGARATADKVLNHILSARVCTLPDLVKATKRPTRAIYTALWSLKKRGLIDSRPIAGK